METFRIVETSKGLDSYENGVLRNSPLGGDRNLQIAPRLDREFPLMVHAFINYQPRYPGGNGGPALSFINLSRSNVKKLVYASKSKRKNQIYVNVQDPAIIGIVRNDADFNELIAILRQQYNQVVRRATPNAEAMFETQLANMRIFYQDFGNVLFHASNQKFLAIDRRYFCIPYVIGLDPDGATQYLSYFRKRNPKRPLVQSESFQDYVRTLFDVRLPEGRRRKKGGLIRA